MEVEGDSIVGKEETQKVEANIMVVDGSNNNNVTYEQKDIDVNGANEKKRQISATKKERDRSRHRSETKKDKKSKRTDKKRDSRSRDEADMQRNPQSPKKSDNHRRDRENDKEKNKISKDERSVERSKKTHKKSHRSESRKSTEKKENSEMKEKKEKSEKLEKTEKSEKRQKRSKSTQKGEKKDKKEKSEKRSKRSESRKKSEKRSKRSESRKKSEKRSKRSESRKKSEKRLKRSESRKKSEKRQKRSESRKKSEKRSKRSESRKKRQKRSESRKKRSRRSQEKRQKRSGSKELSNHEQKEDMNGSSGKDKQKEMKIMEKDKKKKHKEDRSHSRSQKKNQKDNEEERNKKEKRNRDEKALRSRDSRDREHDRHGKRKQSRSSSYVRKHMSEAEMRRIEREKRCVGEYYSHLKPKPNPNKTGKEGEGKFIDSNNMQIDTEKYFWDGFCWQPRISKLGIDENIMKQTEKQRKIQLQNVPLHLGLDNIDIISYISNFMKENALANEGNDNPVLNCEINEEDKTANIELSSVEETNLMYKLMTFKFFQNECKIYRICDSNVAQPSMQALTQQAIRQAEAQAAVIKATENILHTNPDKPSADAVKNDNKIVNGVQVISPIIKVCNTIQMGYENTLTEENWEDLHADLIEEFERYGTVIFHFIIRPYQATVGGFLKNVCIAKAGTLFIEYSNKESAEKAIEINNGRSFNGLSLKLYSLPTESFNLNFRPLISIRQ